MGCTSSSQQAEPHLQATAASPRNNNLSITENVKEQSDLSAEQPVVVATPNIAGPNEQLSSLPVTTAACPVDQVQEPSLSSSIESASENTKSDVSTSMSIPPSAHENTENPTVTASSQAITTENSLAIHEQQVAVAVETSQEVEKQQEENTEEHHEPEPTFSPPNPKKGMINKRGHVIKNWKNRFFVLSEGVLSYYESSSPSPPYGIGLKGHMTLNNCSLRNEKTTLIIRKEGLSSKHDGHDELYLDIKYPNEREEWIEAIQSHIEYYTQ